jgi:hypothetical protein
VGNRTGAVEGATNDGTALGKNDMFSGVGAFSESK